jgi:hypothetical protein
LSTDPIRTLTTLKDFVDKGIDVREKDIDAVEHSIRGIRGEFERAQNIEDDYPDETLTDIGKDVDKNEMDLILEKGNKPSRYVEVKNVKSFGPGSDRIQRYGAQVAKKLQIAKNQGVSNFDIHFVRGITDAGKAALLDELAGASQDLGIVLAVTGPRLVFDESTGKTRRET